MKKLILLVALSIAIIGCSEFISNSKYSQPSSTPVQPRTETISPTSTPTPTPTPTPVSPLVEFAP